jgi:hypothetical protein
VEDGTAYIGLVVETLNALDGVHLTHIPVQEQGMSCDQMGFLLNLPYRTVADCVGLQSLILGTSRYGSGYPYGVSSYYVDNRCFLFGFWTIPIQDHYYCQYECVSYTFSSITLPVN